MDIDWHRALVGQLEFYWDVHLRPRLDGLTDEEYLWEPVAGCWNLRRKEHGYVLDWVAPAPDPPPVTTIAWRLLHVAIGCLAARTRTFFTDETRDMFTVGAAMYAGDLPGTAADGLAYLETAYRDWHAAIAGLDAAALAAPLGPKGGPYADDPMAGLIFHLNREVMHHGAEICLLRDLYRSGLSMPADPDRRLSEKGTPREDHERS